MARYKANVGFGPWKAGEIFESIDPFHAKLAEEGRLLSEVDGAPAQADEVADAAAPERPLWGWEESP